MRVMLPLMNLIITKWLLVYVLENKHNFYVIHFLSLTVYVNIEIDTAKVTHFEIQTNDRRVTPRSYFDEREVFNP